MPESALREVPVFWKSRGWEEQPYPAVAVGAGASAADCLKPPLPVWLLGQNWGVFILRAPGQETLGEGVGQRPHPRRRYSKQ